MGRDEQANSGRAHDDHDRAAVNRPPGLRRPNFIRDTNVSKSVDWGFRNAASADVKTEFGGAFAATGAQPEADDAQAGGGEA
jgi:hypothetical protein